MFYLLIWQLNIFPIYFALQSCSPPRKLHSQGNSRREDCSLICWSGSRYARTYVGMYCCCMYVLLLSCPASHVEASQVLAPRVDANNNNPPALPPSSAHPSNHTPSTPHQPHPQSSNVLPEAHAPTTTDEGPESVFDRNRSMSMPLRRRRPRSASHSHQRRGVHSVMEGSELSDSMDSGLATTCSYTNLAA